MAKPARITGVVAGRAHIKRILEEPQTELAGIADRSPQSGLRLC